MHYNDVIMEAIASQITSLTIVYSVVYSDADQRKHQSSASLAFVGGIHRGPVNSPHKWPVTRKMFPFDDVIMDTYMQLVYVCVIWFCWHMGYPSKNHPKLKLHEISFTNGMIYLKFCPEYTDRNAWATDRYVKNKREFTRSVNYIL